MPYKAFISYSHEADGEFADQLHDAMEKLAKPWTKRRARRVALDRTAMAAGSSLTDTIEEKLADSAWLVLLAAPASAQSKWVNDEIDYWAANKSMDNVVVVLTGGDIAVDSAEQRVDWENSTALSDRFRAAVGDDAVPLYEDLRPFKGGVDHANLRNGHFRDEVANIVGRIEGQDPGELASEDKRQYKHSVRLRRTAEIGLVALTIAAMVLGVRAVLSERRAVANEKRAIENEQLAIKNEQLAMENERRAVENERRAVENERRAVENEQQAISGAVAAQGIATLAEVPDLGALLALESMRIRPTVDAFISIVNSVVTPTNFQWRATVDGEPIITAAASSSDGTLVAMGNEFGDVWLMSPDSPDPIEILVVTEEFEEIISVAFAENDTVLRVLDLEGDLTTWDVALASLTDVVPLGEFLGGAISGDGSTVIVADRSTIRVFDGAGAEIAQQDLEVGLNNCESFNRCVVAVSNDGRELAWVETDGLEDIVMIWTEGDEPFELFRTPQLVTAMAFTPGGETLVVAEDGGTAHILPATADSLVLYDVDPDLFADADFLDFAFAEDDGFLVRAATAHLNGSVKLWELDPEFGFGVLVEDFSRHNDEVRSVAYSPDGSSIVSGGWDGDIISWSSEPAAKHGTITREAHEAPILDVTFVGSGSQLASVSENGVVSLWNASDSGQLTAQRSFFVSDDILVIPYSIDASPNGDTIAVGILSIVLEEDADEGAVLLFDVASGAQVGMLVGSDSRAQSVAFSADGRWLAAGFSDGPISVWDIDALDGPSALELGGRAFTTGGVAFSGDSRLIAASDNGVIRVWDANTGAEIVTVTGNEFATVTAVALNSDGSILAWGDNTRLIGLWDIINDERIGQNLKGHREEISDLQFVETPGAGTDTLLASTSRDAETRVWSFSAGRLVARIPAHTNDVSAVDVSESGTLMVTSGIDGAIWVGALDPESWVEAACVLAGRNMSLGEWQTVQSDNPYVRHCGQYPSGKDAPEHAEVWKFEFTGVVGTTDS